MRLLLFWCWLFLLPVVLPAQNCPLPAPLRIPANDSVEYSFEIFDVINDDLGNPGQGVCGVHLRFVHNAIFDFEAWLTSPSGQTVNLIGPNATVNASTIFGLWDITFMPCNFPAQPDPPFQAKWDNQVNFFTASNYKGQYYPYQGCLEDFKSGPVNGTWKLKLKTFPTSIIAPGRLLDIDILLCDPLGQNCCFADAGRIPGPSTLRTCAADSSLILNLTPEYSGTKPDTNYRYTWLIGLDSMFIGIADSVDLRQYPQGQYQVCGLSYDRTQRDSFPSPNGILRLDTLRNRLNSPTPPFCGDMTDTCLSVIILPRLDTGMVQTTICEGDTFRLGNRVLTQAGRYIADVPSSAGCDSAIVVDLFVIPATRPIISQTICAGESVTLGGYAYNTTGLFRDTLTAASGCDSIVTLDLTVLPLATRSVNGYICAGGVYRFGTRLLTQPGVYTDTFPSQSGCDSLIILTLDLLDPDVKVNLPDTITCNSPQVILDASASQPAGRLEFRWEGLNGAILGNQPTLAVNQPGRYVVQAILRAGTSTCVEQAALQVVANLARPGIAIAPPDTLTCSRPEIVLSETSPPSGLDLRYRWSTVDGRFNGPDSLQQIRVTGAGSFLLRVQNQGNGCDTSATVTVVADTLVPVAIAGPDQELNCLQTSVVLDGSQSLAGPSVRYAWNGPCLNGPTNQASATATCEGLYTLELRNDQNGCQSRDSVVVNQNKAIPVAMIQQDTVDIDCQTGNSRLDGSGSSGGSITWFFQGQAAGADSILTVTRPGPYTLIVADNTLGCRDSATVQVISDCQPEAIVALPDTLNCHNPIVTLNAAASTAGPQMRYQWIAPQAGCFIQAPDQPITTVRCGGTYQFIATNSALNLSDTATIEVAIDTLSPIALAAPADTLTCKQPQVLLDGRNSTSGPGMIYIWTNFLGDTLSTGPTAQVSEEGFYFLEVVNTRNGCRDAELVVVNQDLVQLTITFSDALIPCDQDSLLLKSTVTPAGGPYRYAWTGPAIAGPADRDSIWAAAPGRYALMLTDTSNGCTASGEVAVRPQPCSPCVDVARPDTLTCARTQIQLQATLCSPCGACTIQWTSLNNHPIQGDNSLSPVVSASGTYQLSVRDTNGLTTIREVVVFRDTFPPSADAGPDRNITCATPRPEIGNLIPDTTGHFRYAWTNASGQALNNAGSQRLTVSEAGSYFMTITSLRTGCSARDTVAVGIDTIAPSAEAGLPQVITCKTPRLALNAAGSSTGSTIRYSWEALGGGRIVVGPGSSTPLIDAAGTYRLTVEDARNGCTDQDSVAVTEDKALPILPLIPDVTLNCRDSLATLSGALPPGNRFYNFEWCALGTGGDTLFCQNTLNLNTRAPGDYIFTVTDTTNGCRNTELASVLIDRTPPQIDAGPDDILLCNNTTITLKGSAGPQGRNFRIRWTGNKGQVITADTTLSPTVSDTGTYHLQVQDAGNFCIVMDSVRIGLDDRRPFVNAGPDTLINCFNPRIRLQGSSELPNRNLEWRWTSVDGQIVSDGNTLSPLIGSAGTYQFTVRNRQNGCSASDFVEVRDNFTRPDAALTSEGPFILTCRIDSVVLDGRVSRSLNGGALDFSWRNFGGSIIGNPAQALITAKGPGLYRLIVTDRSNGCRDSLNIQVEGEFFKPLVRVTAPPPLTCATSEVVLFGNVDAPEGRYLYKWAGPGGSALPGDTPQILVSRAGDYSLTVTNARTGCFTEQKIRVTEDKAAPIIRIEPPEALDCDTRVAALDASGTKGSNLAFVWSTPDGQLGGDPASAIARAGAGGLYRLRVTNTANTCFATDSVRVLATANAIDSAEVELVQPGCGPERQGRIEVGAIFGGAAPYRFSLNGGQINSRGIFERLDPGNYVLEVKDAAGCAWSSNLILEVPQPLFIDLGEDREIRLGDSVTLKAQLNVEDDGAVFRWAPANGLNGTSGFAQTVKPTATTTYQVTVTGVNGCTTVDAITIRVLEDLPVYIPNAFSPDGDGVNDIFYINAAASYVREIESFQIFDRWGTMVFGRERFQPNDLTYGWDGSFRGKALKSGVYVFYVMLETQDGRKEMIKGEVTLLR